MTSADFILRKALVAADIPSSDWSRVHAGLRNRAFFMSRVTNERVLYAARQSVREMLERGKSASEIRRDVRRLITPADRPSDPKDVGTIKDIHTKRRLDVVIEQNVRQARGYANHLSATSEGALRAFPGYELVRVRRAKAPRDWDRLWKEAARKVGYAGVNRETSEKIALKTSPVWVALSKFGNPFPPFDWGSGMGLDDVPRSKCAALGLVGDDIEEQTPPKLDLNGHLEVTLPFKNDETWKILKKACGDQIQIDKKTGTVKWRDEIFEENFERGGTFTIKLGAAQPSLSARLPDFNGWKKGHLTVTQDWLDNERDDGTDHRSHFKGHGDDAAPLDKRDIALLPALWRTPDRAWLDTDKRHIGRNGVPRLVLELDALDGGVYRAVVDIGTNTPNLKTFYKRAPMEQTVPSHSERRQAAAPAHRTA